MNSAFGMFLEISAFIDSDLCDFMHNFSHFFFQFSIISQKLYFFLNMQESISRFEKETKWKMW